MKDLLKSLGFLAFIFIVFYFLFHRKHWWKAWLIVIGLSVFGNYMKERQDKLDKENYDHTPGYVYFQRNLDMNNWR